MKLGRYGKTLLAAKSCASLVAIAISTAGSGAWAQQVAEGAPPSLLPPGEEDRMAPRPVEPDRIFFKPGRGLTAVSEDGDFLMSLQLRAQFRYTLEHERGPRGDTLQSFQIRRARVKFKGHVFGEHNKYKTEIAVSPRDMSMTEAGPTTSPLLDWYFDFDYLRDLTLRVGQYKVPFNRQRVVSSGDLQFVDRAVTNREFNLDRDIGLELRSKNLFGLDLLRYHAGIYPGEGRNTFQLNDFGMMYIGRVEVLPFGMFEDYDEPDFERTGPRLSLGAAYAYVDNAKRDRGIKGSIPIDEGTTDTHNAVGDAMFKLWGLSVYGAFFYRTGERNPGPLVDEAGDPILDEEGNPIAVAPTRDGIGVLAQAGYLLPRTSFELAARYAVTRGRDEAGRDGMLDRDEIGGGVSYYFARHLLKLQADYFRIVPEQNFDRGVDEFRIQLQAAY